MPEELDNPSRFETLAARFFDGELDEAEDRELAGLLESDSSLARRFIEMARIDRAVAGLASGRRVSDEAFEAAVRRSLSIDTEDESQRFAEEVVELVRGSSERRRTRRLLPISQRKSADMALFAAAAAACVGIALLAFLFVSGGPARVATTNPRTPSAPETPTLSDDSQPLKKQTPPRNDNRPAVVEQQAPPRREPESDVAAGTRNGTAPADPKVGEGVGEGEGDGVAATTTVPLVKHEPIEPIESPSDLPAKALARIERLTNATASLNHDGAAAEAKTGVSCAEGDAIRIVAQGSPGNAPRGSKDGADIVLSDGSRIWLAPGSEFRFHTENESIAPTLVSGELLARVRPQKAGHPLRIRTQQGPVVEVVGTVFRLSAETGRKRVTLSVDEGKVLFSNQGVERKVTADEFCDAEDGHAPGQVGRLRPAPAVLSGIALEKSSGKPMANALVTAVPLARRKGETHFPSVRTDVQGRFKFETLRDGPYFVMAESDGGGGAASAPPNQHWGLARVKLSAVEETVVITADKPAIVIGVIEDSAKHLLINDARVHFLSEGGDGQTINPVLAPVETKDGMQLGALIEYRCAVIEGAGKYAPTVEKPGMLVKVRTPRNVQLVNDRVNQWMLDVQTAPSAVVKGRVLDSVSSNVLADEAGPGADANDPRQARTVLTLTLMPGGGTPHIACAEADGSFVFNTNLDAGAYELKAQRFGYAPAAKRLTLTAGQAFDCDIQLESLHAQHQK